MISQETLDELAWHEENDKPYYRPLISYEGYATLACMQWFDEYDYDESRFFKDSDGDLLRFESKEEGIRWLNENIKSDMIDLEYRKYNHIEYYK
ncbi:hypothetical protein [Paenibacillus lactis]|uniref:hypothetical protein n=1 Tax=Paenibacillus lactis TaxID=228574 RepID=UPI003D70DBB6